MNDSRLFALKTMRTFQYYCFLIKRFKPKRNEKKTACTLKYRLSKDTKVLYVWRNLKKFKRGKKKLEYNLLCLECISVVLYLDFCIIILCQAKIEEKIKIYEKMFSSISLIFLYSKKKKTLMETNNRVLLELRKKKEDNFILMHLEILK